MKRKHFLIALCVIAFTTGAFALNRKLHFVQKFVGVETGVQSYQQQNKPLSTSLKLSGKIDEFSRIQSKPIPERIVYDQLFHAVVAFGKKARQQEKNSKPITPLLNYFQNQYQLSERQIMFLKEVADNYIVEILPIEERAKILIKHFRDNHKNDSLSENDTLPAPQGKLIEFQNERDSIVSRYRDRLRELFGEEDFQRFDLKLKQDTSANTRMMTLDEVREKIREEKNKKDSSQPTENLQKNNGSKGGQ